VSAAERSMILIGSPISTPCGREHLATFPQDGGLHLRPAAPPPGWSLRQTLPGLARHRSCREQRRHAGARRQGRQCRHEVALHVRMGNSHRPAIRDLGLEERHHSFDCAPWPSPPGQAGQGCRGCSTPLRYGTSSGRRTLPKRTETNERPLCCAASCTIPSTAPSQRFVLPAPVPPWPGGPGQGEHRDLPRCAYSIRFIFPRANVKNSRSASGGLLLS